jgi:hypothetical protein
MAAGRRPFEGESALAVMMALNASDPRPVRDFNPQVPEALADLIHRLLAKAPDGRPASAQAVVDELRQMEGGPAPARPAVPPRRVETDPAPTPPVTPRPQPPARRPGPVAGIDRGGAAGRRRRPDGGDEARLEPRQHREIVGAGGGRRSEGARRAAGPGAGGRAAADAAATSDSATGTPNAADRVATSRAATPAARGQ